MAQLDEYDRQIVQLLQQDGRMSVAELARHVGLSRVATHERFNRLVKSRVIHEFVAVVDSAAIGYGINAFLEIEISPNSIEAISEILVAIPEVMIVYQMTGPTCLHVHANARDSEDLARLLQEKIYTIPGVLKVTTSLLLKRYKSNLSLR